MIWQLCDKTKHFDYLHVAAFDQTNQTSPVSRQIHSLFSFEIFAIWLPWIHVRLFQFYEGLICHNRKYLYDLKAAWSICLGLVIHIYESLHIFCRVIYTANSSRHEYHYYFYANFENVLWCKCSTVEKSYVDSEYSSSFCSRPSALLPTVTLRKGAILFSSFILWYSLSCILLVTNVYYVCGYKKRSNISPVSQHFQ